MTRSQCRSHDPPPKAPFATESCGDHIISNSSESWGLQGKQYAVVLYDRGSSWIGGYPNFSKTAEETTASFHHFFGDEVCKRFYSDKSLELIKAARNCGFLHDTATPGRPDTNGVAEAAVRRVIEGTKATLFQAGFDTEWWPHAMNHWCFASNIEVVDGESA